MPDFQTMLGYQCSSLGAQMDLANRSEGQARTLTNNRLTGNHCASVCKGCGQEIFDQYILRVAPDLEWHAACLKCSDCQRYLDENCTCFVREAKIYCKNDYLRLFSAKCTKCQQTVKPLDYVMRVRPNRIFHVHCFHCEVCRRTLVPGEEFALRENGLFCKNDHEILERASSKADHPVTFGCLNDSNLETSLFPAANQGRMTPPLHHNNSRGDTPPLGPRSPGSPCCNNRVGLVDSPSILIGAPLSVSGSNSSPGSDGSSTVCHQRQHRKNNSNPNNASANANHSHANSTNGKEYGSGLHHRKDRKDKPKTTRVRTVLNEKQLHTLRSIYMANPRPDALMKEQLTDMTGLSPRVIRVWFQNKRCKDKKRQIAEKQRLQQQEKNLALNNVRLQGVGPLITGTPSRYDMPLVQALEVHQFQQSHAIWAAKQQQGLMPSDFCGPPPHLHLGRPDHLLGVDPQTPFQQLMHGFGDPSIDHTLGYLPSSLAYAATINADMTSLSPQMANSELSSPSCVSE